MSVHVHATVHATLDELTIAVVTRAADLDPYVTFSVGGYTDAGKVTIFLPLSGCADKLRALADDIDRYDSAVAADPSTVTVDGLAGVGTARTTPAEPPNRGGPS